MFRKQLLTGTTAVLLALAGSALAADPPAAPTDGSGFYGGISLRASGRDGEGLAFGHLASAWSRFTLPTADDNNGTRTLAYGGYRWANDVAVEAALATLDRYALQPALSGARRGVGLALVPESDAKTWNVDVYTSWEFRKSMSLYGRLGYAQTEPQAAYVPSFSGDVVRRNRDGVNYGLGLRYDMTPALGLRVEYARFGRLPGELVNGVLPESDQVQLGLQFRF